MARALVFLATGFEEIEAISIVDVLRRANIEVSLASIENSLDVCGAHGVLIKADCLAKDIRETFTNNSFDIVILPGGLPGSNYLDASSDVSAILEIQNKEEKNIAAICAAPLVLCNKGLMKGRKVTSYPNCISDLNGATYVEDRVVTDGHITTSRGPGTAIEFALALVALLVSPEQAKELQNKMLVKC